MEVQRGNAHVDGSAAGQLFAACRRRSRRYPRTGQFIFFDFTVYKLFILKLVADKVLGKLFYVNRCSIY
jgi:hypothetical protein